jgi:hypothetical protein
MLQNLCCVMRLEHNSLWGSEVSSPGVPGMDLPQLNHRWHCTNSMTVVQQLIPDQNFKTNHQLTSKATTTHPPCPTIAFNKPMTLDKWQKLWFRASPVVLSMWPCKIFLTFKFSNLLFSNPSHKTKTGTANRWETTSSNPPWPIKLSSQSIAGVRFCCAFYQPQKTVQKCWAKTILLSQSGMLWLFLIQF